MSKKSANLQELSAQIFDLLDRLEESPDEAGRIVALGQLHEVAYDMQKLHEARQVEEGRVTIAMALKVLFDQGVFGPSFAFFTDTEPYICNPETLTCEPGEPAMKITFCDGSVAWYDDGDYWLDGEKP
jgi:hypothetical protein